jgi:hypothetical protein
MKETKIIEKLRGCLVPVFAIFGGVFVFAFQKKKRF